jgi:putative molybdopterin biosynthesis protein
MSSRKIYLKMKSLKEARETFLSKVDLSCLIEAESVPTIDSLGRITSEPVFARISSPNFPSAAMDGIAVSAEKTYSAHVSRPIKLKIGEDAFYVNTGNLMPPKTDAVIMIEHVTPIEGDFVMIESPAFPWQNVRKVGEDIIATELILPQNHRITPYDIGALLGGGVGSVKVWKRPKVVIIPTGSELVECEAMDSLSLEEAKVIEFNSYVIRALVSQWGGEPIRYGIVPDQPDAIMEALERAIDEDAKCIIINAGSSAGSEDYTALIIEKKGEVIVHGVAMMPGKPTVLGIVEGRPVIGNPGYPVSAIISCEQFLAPLLSMMLGQQFHSRKSVIVSPSRKIPSKLGIEEFVRVKLGKVGDKIIATPLPRGAGSITTISQADGIIRIPEDVEGIGEGEETEAELIRSEEEVNRTLVIIGSHDLLLDLLANHIKKMGGGIHISSSHVGSLGGIMAIRKGHAHVAGSHLLDPSTGEYNIPYIKRYLSGMEIYLINLTYRDQGLILKKGNPKGIKGLEDLTRKDVIFVNRQSGSGTRVLLDYKLKGLGINPYSIRGYDHEEFTHMAVAVEVLSGAADAGLGIYAAAKALDLDFIPVVTERYDLIIPGNYLHDEKVKVMIDVIKSKRFREDAESLGGYNLKDAGKIIFP